MTHVGEKVGLGLAGHLGLLLSDNQSLLGGIEGLNGCLNGIGHVIKGGTQHPDFILAPDARTSGEVMLG